MLYETLSQPTLLLIFFLCGVIAGFIYDIGNFIKFLCGNKKFACVFIDVLEVCCCLALIFFCNLKFNYGVLRLFPYFVFFLSFSIERFTIGKIIAKIYLVCYNFFVRLTKRVLKKINDRQKHKNN